jgi:hypothetical protein
MGGGITLPSLPKQEVWAKTARFAYQTIEKRRIRGKAFRLMYADFLQEASELLTELAFMKAPERMRQAREGWQEAARILGSASLTQDSSGLLEADKRVTLLTELETRIYLDLEATIGPILSCQASLYGYSWIFQQYCIFPCAPLRLPKEVSGRLQRRRSGKGPGRSDRC